MSERHEERALGGVQKVGRCRIGVQRVVQRGDNNAQLGMEADRYGSILINELYGIIGYCILPLWFLSLPSSGSTIQQVQGLLN